MKLRNKKTGEILETGNHAATVWKKNGYGDHYSYNSLAELNEEWEDYKPAEPLIKDEKIRKAVRAWAEVNDFEPEFEVRYSSNSFGLFSWQAIIEFNTAIEGLEDKEKYTIAELCGEEEQ